MCVSRLQQVKRVCAATCCTVDKDEYLECVLQPLRNDFIVFNYESLMYIRSSRLGNVNRVVRVHFILSRISYNFYRVYAGVRNVDDLFSENVKKKNVLCT